MPNPVFTSRSDAKHDRDEAFWRSHGGVGLVWSNRNANDSVMIIHALFQPNFHLLLDIAERFGLVRLKAEWGAVKESVETTGFPEEIAKLRHVTPIVERCIKHMEAALE